MTTAHSFKVTPVRNSAEFARTIVDRILASVRHGGRVLGVATGATFRPTYELLTREHSTGRAVGLDDCHFVLLDEYLGLPDGHPNTYRVEMERALLAPLGLPPERLVSPAVNPAWARDDCAAFEDVLSSLGGVDLQLLGVGANGHIAFNEPGTSRHSTTRVVRLAASTRADNSRYFEDPDQVPTHAVTQGIATIMSARDVLLAASGPSKASITASILSGRVTEDVPATALLEHPSCQFVVDADALAGTARQPASGPPDSETDDGSPPR
jgi:glucosamine-6-phosphate deaminase